MSFEMLRQEVDGDTAYTEWRAETTDNIYEVGSDTFIVGMEVTQAFRQDFSEAVTSSRVLVGRGESNYKWTDE